MQDTPTDFDFFKRKLVIVQASDWFVTTDKSAEAERRFCWYIGLHCPTSADIIVYRPIETAKLDAERAMVAEHNRRIDAYGEATSDAQAKFEAKQKAKAAGQGKAKPEAQPMLDQGKRKR